MDSRMATETFTGQLYQHSCLPFLDGGRTNPACPGISVYKSPYQGTSWTTLEPLLNFRLLEEPVKHGRAECKLPRASLLLPG